MGISRIIRFGDGRLAQEILEEEFGGIKIVGMSSAVAEEHFNNKRSELDIDELNEVEFVPVLKDDEVLEIEEKLGYTFENKKYIHRAFSHSSYDYGNDYEVLELIGDRVLDVIITKLIYEAALDEKSGVEESEGCLSELKMHLVCGSNLARLSDKLGLTKYLAIGMVGDEAIKDEIRNSESIKEDLFEAVIGAVALDTGWDFVILEQLIKRIHDYRNGIYEYNLKIAQKALCELQKIPSNIEKEFLTAERTAKEKLDRAVNFLQELMQKGLLEVLDYDIQEDRDSNGNPVWWCVGDAWYDNYDIGWTCKASTKTESKKFCAIAMISRLYEELSKDIAKKEKDICNLRKEVKKLYE